jgi:5-oxoprolinase (ATP-hydrolysing) subunit A
MRTIDFNSDMGEIRALIDDGTQEALMASLTSVNVACGAHAGDEFMMRTTIEQALTRNVAVGAHPGYADRENFGRIELKVTPETIAASVYDQVCALARVAAQCGVSVRHVKPHGALYNQAALDPKVAAAIASGISRWRRDVVLMGLAGSDMLRVFRDAGFAVAAEAFVDRRYEPNGTLRSRKFPDALIHDPTQAAQQALRIVERGSVLAWDGTEVSLRAETLCVHGDTPGAQKIAAAVAEALRRAGVPLRPLTTE